MEISEAYGEPSGASKMEHFTKIVNGFTKLIRGSLLNSTKEEIPLQEYMNCGYAKVCMTAGINSTVRIENKSLLNCYIKYKAFN